MAAKYLDNIFTKHTFIVIAAWPSEATKNIAKGEKTNLGISFVSILLQIAKQGLSKRLAGLEAIKHYF